MSDGRAWTHLALVGLMGSGKSSVGTIVAERLGVPMVDVDDEVQARTGATVEELWRRGGEAAYRPLERAVVVEALDQLEPRVLAAPGGVVLDRECVAALRRPHVAVVYLRADPAVLADRVRGDPQPRPLVEPQNPGPVLADQFAARDDHYARLAHLVLRIDWLEPEAAADAILARGLLGT